MAVYEKWLGAGLGFVVGGPMGSMIGYAAGEQIGKPNKQYSKTANTSEFETNLLLLAAKVIKANGKTTQEEMKFVRQFFSDHFSPDHIEEKVAILKHCIERNYDTRKACDDIRTSSKQTTRTQIVHFLFDLAVSDGTIDKRESDIIFTISGWLNVNDVEFRKIKTLYSTEYVEVHSIFGMAYNAPFDEIKASYRKLVLEYHPDRNTHLSLAEQKAVAEKFRKVQEAFDRIREERGID